MKCGPGAGESTGEVTVGLRMHERASDPDSRTVQSRITGGGMKRVSRELPVGSRPVGWGEGSG
jgi:hypothetical protein